MKVVIVDDERLAREGLRGLLLDFPFVELCGEAANATTARQLIAEVQPDLIFLDIEMTNENGFDLLESLPTPHPRVIFVTAYSAHAVRAFEVNALDYLLKPVAQLRLAAALDKVCATPPATSEDLLKDTTNQKILSVTPGPELALREDDHVFVRDGDRCWFVPVSAIRLLESDGNHTRVYFNADKPLLYRTLASMEERLPSRLFLRANRSQLINLTSIESIGQWFSGTLKVTLRGGFEVEFSRQQAKIFRTRMSL